MEMNLTDRPVFKTLLFYSIPILLGNLFQQLYNIVDTIVVGHTLGDHALAAVGSAGILYALFLYFITGMTSGFSIVVAKLYGKKDNVKLKRAVALSIVYGIIISIGITVLSLCFIRFILNLLHTPSEIYGDCISYISFVLCFLTITMIYNLEAAILRALGDSKTPLIYLIISSFINIVLDYLLIACFHTGVLGAAIATIIAQMISSILCFIHIIKRFPILKLHKQDLHFDKELSKNLLSMGTTMGLSSSIVSIGSIVLQSAINQLGTDIITAHTAARKIDETMMLPLISFAIALSTFISQNVGAKKYHRIKEGIINMIKIAWSWSFLCMIIVFLFGSPLVQALSGTSSTKIIHTATTYLKVNIPFFFFLSLLFIFRNGLQGLEKKTVPMITSVIEFISKILTVLILTPMLGYVGIMISEPIIWIICAIVCLLSFKKEYHRLNQ